MLEQARKIYPAPKYKIQKIADKFTSADFNIKILFLPVAHPELNPIEIVWGRVKRAVARNNLTFQLAAVEQETKRQVDNISAHDFKKFANHAKKEEEKYTQLSNCNE